MKAFYLVLLWQLPNPDSSHVFIGYDNFSQCEIAAQSYATKMMSWVRRNPDLRSLSAIRGSQPLTLTEVHMSADSGVTSRKSWVVSFGAQDIASATCEARASVPEPWFSMLGGHP